MKDKLIIIGLFLFLLTSCKSDDQKKMDANDVGNNSKDKTKKPPLFLSNDEVELLIKNKNPIFIDFWIGMSKKEVTEVTRYLLFKELIIGIVYDPKDSSTSVKRCLDLSLDFDNKCGFVELNKNNYSLLKSSDDKKLLVLIDHTLFEIEFIFRKLNLKETLSEINLVAISELTTSSFVSYSDFKKISELYIEKYGKPMKSILNNEKSGFCIFNNKNCTIDIDYSSEKKSEIFKNFTAPNQIHIKYYNEQRIKEEKNYQKAINEKIKKTNDYNRRKLEEEVHSESLKKI